MPAAVINDAVANELATVRQLTDAERDAAIDAWRTELAALMKEETTRHGLQAAKRPGGRVEVRRRADRAGDRGRDECDRRKQPGASCHRNGLRRTTSHRAATPHRVVTMTI